MQPEQLIHRVALFLPSSNSFYTDIISIKGLVHENCPASAVDCYFTASEKCSTIRLLGNILLD